MFTVTHISLSILALSAVVLCQHSRQKMEVANFQPNWNPYPRLVNANYGSRRDVRCDFPEEPSLGRVKLEGRNPGDRVFYECAPGYKLIGVSSNSCTNRGRWSGQPPACVTLQSTSQTLEGHTTIMSVVLMVGYTYVAMS